MRKKTNKVSKIIMVTLVIIMYYSNSSTSSYLRTQVYNTVMPVITYLGIGTKVNKFDILTENNIHINGKSVRINFFVKGTLKPFSVKNGLDIK
jgi:hypothetical protein